MARSTATDRGFTLIELMVVVVIVGVLATLGVVGFQKLVGTARTTEATQMVQSIKSAQEAFHAETGTYADLSPAICDGTSSSCGSFYPQNPEGSNTVGPIKYSWGVPCGAACNQNMDWLMLPVHTQGAVMYGYSTIAGLASNTTPSSTIGGASFPASLGAGTGAITLTPPTSVAADWYLISAVGNPSDDANPCAVLGTSFTTDLVVANEGN